jgi:hypothetical protein
VSFTENRGQVRTIARAVTAAGADWPPDLQAALDAADKVADSTPVGTPEAVADAYAAAVLAGRPPATDKAVQAALTAHQLTQVCSSGALSQVAARLRAEALTAHAAGIGDQLRHVVADADKVLIAAREVLPHLDAREPEQVRGASPDQAAAWARGRDAATRVQQAVAAWTALGSTLGLPGLDPRRRPLILADLTPDQLDALGHHPDAMLAVHAGHQIDLATPQVYTDRVDKVVAERAAEPARLAAEAHEEYRSVHGITV